MANTVQLAPSNVRAINDQVKQVFRVQGIVQCVKGAMERHFGGDWPADVPQFDQALETADEMLGRIADALFHTNVEEAAEKIEAQWAEEARMETTENTE